MNDLLFTAPEAELPFTRSVVVRAEAPATWCV